MGTVHLLIHFLLSSRELMLPAVMPLPSEVTDTGKESSHHRTSSSDLSGRHWLTSAPQSSKQPPPKEQQERPCGPTRDDALSAPWLPATGQTGELGAGLEATLEVTFGAVSERSRSTLEEISSRHGGRSPERVPPALVLRFQVCTSHVPDAREAAFDATFQRSSREPPAAGLERRSNKPRSVPPSVSKMSSR